MTSTITSISPSKHNPNMRDIYVDEKLAMTLPASIILQLKIQINCEWTSETNKRIASIAETEKARRLATSLISRRMWGCDELKTRLIKRGIEQSIATTTIEQLVEDGWLNDLQYACALIRQWIQKEPAGRRWLIHKLKVKKISDNVAIEAINVELEEISEQESANKFASLRLAKLDGVEKKVAARRVHAALNRRGFETQVSVDAMRTAQSNSP